jgi:DnaK suppressor protein
MNQKDAKKFKDSLNVKRDDLMKVVRSKKELDLQDIEIGDEIDSATQNAEKEILFELTDNEKTTLDAIDAALKRIEKKKFGCCESCGVEIPVKRLQAIPWVRYCIKCQSKNENSK